MCFHVTRRTSGNLTASDSQLSEEADSDSDCESGSVADVSQVSMQDDGIDNVSVSSQATAITSMTSKTPVSAKTKFRSPTKKEARAELVSFMKAHTQLAKSERDEDELFMILFVPALKRVAAHNRMACKIELMKVISEYELRDAKQLGGRSHQLDENSDWKPQVPNGSHISSPASIIVKHSSKRVQLKASYKGVSAKISHSTSRLSIKVSRCSSQTSMTCHKCALRVSTRRITLT